MISSTNQPFVFSYTDFTFVDNGEFTGLPELRLWGQILDGNITRELPIIFPTSTGPVTGVIGQFMDTLDDWLALPFYNRLDLDNMACEFCLCVISVPTGIEPICPGIAHLSLESG